MADQFKIKIDADLGQLESKFKSTTKVLDNIANKAIKIKVDDEFYKNIEKNSREFKKELEQNTKQLKEHTLKIYQDLAKESKKALPNPEVVKKLKKELDGTLTTLGKMSDMSSRIDKSMSAAGQGIDGGKQGILGKIGGMMSGGGGMFGKLGGLLSGGARFLGPGGMALGALAGGVKFAHGQVQEGVDTRRETTGIGTELATGMGAKKFEGMRGALRQSGVETGFNINEVLQRTKGLAGAYGYRNINQEQVERSLTMERGFGVGQDTQTQFLGAMRRATGKADIGAMEKAIEKGMLGGIDKADLPKFLGVIAEATEKSAMAGEMNMANMSKALGDLASQDKLFRNNPQALQAGLGAMSGLFGSTSGMQGAFARSAILGSEQGKNLSGVGLEWEQALTDDMGIAGLWAKGAGGVDSAFKGGGRLGAMRDEFAKEIGDPSKLTDEETQAAMLRARDIVPGNAPMELKWKMLTEQGGGPGGALTADQKKKFEEEFRGSKTLTDMKGKDFAELQINAQKKALKDEIGDKFISHYQTMNKSLNTIKQAAMKYLGIKEDSTSVEEELTPERIDELADESKNFTKKQRESLRENIKKEKGETKSRLDKIKKDIAFYEKQKEEGGDSWGKTSFTRKKAERLEDLKKEEKELQAKQWKLDKVSERTTKGAIESVAGSGVLASNQATAPTESLKESIDKLVNISEEGNVVRKEQVDATKNLGTNKSTVVKQVQDPTKAINK